MDKTPKNQKEFYQDKIRDYEKRTGKSLNVKGVSKMYYDYDIADTIFNYSAALDLINQKNIYIYHDLLVEEDILSNGTNWLKYGFTKKDGKIYKYYYELKKWGNETKELDSDYNKTKTWKAAKVENKKNNSTNIYPFEVAKQMMFTNHYFIRHESMEEIDKFSKTGEKLKFSYAMRNGIPTKYYYETGKWSHNFNTLSDQDLQKQDWIVAPMYLDPGEDYLPYAVENKHIGSNFDDFVKDNNIEFKRDINWAVKMLDAGKMVSREGNPRITLFPKKYDHAESTITTTDLFAEDWIVVPNKTFVDVLDDLFAGKTIRRKSWYSDWGIGKYARFGKMTYLDIIADDWEVEDVVAEVNKQQEQILKDRNEH